MTDIPQRNAHLLQTRWPLLFDRLQLENPDTVPAQLVEGLGTTLSISGVQLTSRHDRLAEAQLQAATIVQQAPQVHVYGTGLGDLQRVLLQRPALQRLTVHILNSAVFALVLQILEQDDWLADPRVELVMAGDHAEICLPFFALPSELVLADDHNARIRDRLISEVHLAFNNREFTAQDPEIAQRLEEAVPLLHADPDVAQLFGSQPGRGFFVIATGPSLEQHFAKLKAVREQADRPFFICVDTAYRPLLAHGIVPDLVVSIDQRISSRHLPAEGSEAVGLVYLPLLEKSLLESWRGPRHVGYSASPVYAQLREQLPKASLYVGGSVIHPAVDLAVKMGAGRMTLFGADFAFPGDKTHAGWSDGDLGPQLQAAKHWVLDGRGQRVRTQLNFRSYLVELERYIAGHPQVPFFNTSRAGAMIAGTQFDAEWCQ